MFQSPNPYLVPFAFLPLLLFNSLVFAEDNYEIDNTHTSVLFSVSHFNVGYVYGRFNRCDGKVVMNRDDPKQSQFEFTIQSNSIDTNDIGRDKHLKTPDFFDVENYPEITFQSQSVEFEAGTYTVTGVLNLRGVEKEVVIPLQLLGVGKGPFGNTRLGMIGKFMIKRSEFGMDKMLDGIGDDIAITFSFEGVLK